MSLIDCGVSVSDVIFAIEKVQSGKMSAYETPSRSTYIFFDNELWDLKPVVGLVLEAAGFNIQNHPWNSRLYQPDLLRLGFPIVRFNKLKARKLGVRGFKASELNEDHTLFWPPNGEERINAFVEAQNTDIRPRIKSVTSKIFVRNSDLRRHVLAAAKGKCQLCGGKTFQTAAGEWFLEVHHKKWLREGGLDNEENLVALCPNCHRKEHYGIDRKFK